MVPLSPPAESFRQAGLVTLDTGFASALTGGSTYYDAVLDSWADFEWTGERNAVRAGSRVAAVADDGTVTLTDPQSSEVATSGDACAPTFSSIALYAGSREGVVVWGDVGEASPGRGAVLLVAD
jgi:hypothetical protein